MFTCHLDATFNQKKEKWKGWPALNNLEMNKPTT